MEELLHASVENVRLEAHGALEESIRNEPQDEGLVAHEEAVGTEDALLRWMFECCSFCFGLRCIQCGVECSGECQNSEELPPTLDVYHEAEGGDESSDRCILAVIQLSESSHDTEGQLVEGVEAHDE